MIKVYENSSEPKFPDVRSGYLERGFFPYCITFYEERSNNKVSTFGSVDVEYI